MKNRFLNKIIQSAFFICCSVALMPVSAQNKSNSNKSSSAKSIVVLKGTVDRNRIVIGEQIKLVYNFEYTGARKAIKWITVPDSLNHLEIVERSGADSIAQGDKYTIKQTFILTGFDSGHWVIPSLAVTIDKKIYKTDSISIDVIPAKLKGDAYNEIKEIIEVPEPKQDSKLWIGIVATIIILGLLAFYYFRKKKPAPLNPMGFDTRLNPYDQATQELRKLKEEGILEKGEMKNYYSRLYDIFRVYLQRQFGMPVLQSTTDELLILVKDKLGRDETGRLAETLRVGDAVKFAKYGSSVEEGKTGFSVIESGIRLLQQPKT